MNRYRWCWMNSMYMTVELITKLKQYMTISSAPYWLIPTPCPYPHTSKVKVPSAYVSVKQGLRRPKAARTCSPVKSLPPMGILVTVPDSEVSRSPTQLPVSPDRFAPSSEAAFSRNWSAVRTRVEE